jgi:hypothetical protein
MQLTDGMRNALNELVQSLSIDQHLEWLLEESKFYEQQQHAEERLRCLIKLLALKGYEVRPCVEPGVICEFDTFVGFFNRVEDAAIEYGRMFGAIPEDVISALNGFDTFVSARMKQENAMSVTA